MRLPHGLTLPPLRVERGGLVWDAAQRANVWREDAVTVTVTVTVTVFDKTIGE